MDPQSEDPALPTRLTTMKPRLHGTLHHAIGPGSPHGLAQLTLRGGGVPVHSAHVLDLSRPRHVIRIEEMGRKRRSVSTGAQSFFRLRLEFKSLSLSFSLYLSLSLSPSPSPGD